MVHASNATNKYFVEIGDVDYQQKELNLQNELQTVIYYNKASMFNVLQTSAGWNLTLQNFTKQYPHKWVEIWFRTSWQPR